MSETPTPPALEPEERMSLPSRLFNIYATPGDVFAEVAAAEHAVSNWLVPMILTALVTVLVINVMFSQPAIMRQVQEQQAAEMQKNVDAGKMTKEQAKQAQDALEKMGPTLFKVLWSIGGVVGGAVWMCLLVLALWLICKVAWKSSVPFTKTLEVAGLASMISLLGGLVAIPLMIAKGNMLVTLGPALFIEQIDPANKVHLALSSVNVITLWYVGVLSLGLARATGRSFGGTAVWLYGAWALLRTGIVASGMAASGM
jgi:hypothetical protein